MRMAPNYIQAELKAIDPRLFVVWNPQKKRWQIREWVIIHPTRWDLLDPNLWQKKSSLCHTVCERDEMYRDISYRNLDNRAILTILKSRRFSEDADVEARKIDEENEAMQARAEQETQDIAKDCAKRLYHGLQRPTIYLGGE